MKYVVLSPSNQMICFDHSDQVTEYCLEKENEGLDECIEERGYNYADMSSTEVGQMYTEAGATRGGCKIFQTSKVIKEMKENYVEEELIEQAKDLFNDRRLHHEIKCPGFLEDFFGEMTPLAPGDFSDGVYYMENIDDPDDIPDRG